MSLKIVEVFDGRLPEYQVVRENINSSEVIVISTFDSFEDADRWINERFVL